jgi:hypothetical protein
VDGKVRFAPDQPSTIDKNQKIVNFIEIDQYMIEKAEKARGLNNVKNMADCIASESSWRLSENFERNCKVKYPELLDEDIDLSIEMNSVDDSC